MKHLSSVFLISACTLLSQGMIFSQKVEAATNEEINIDITIRNDSNVVANCYLAKSSGSDDRCAIRKAVIDPNNTKPLHYSCATKGIVLLFCSAFERELEKNAEYEAIPIEVSNGDHLVYSANPAEITTKK